MKSKQGDNRITPNRSGELLSALAGIWLGLSLLKFGNPSLFADRVPRPTQSYELLLNSWPVSWGYGLLAIVAIIAGFQWHRPRGLSNWLFWLPALWFLTQVVATLTSASRELSLNTLMHFASVAVCFYIGIGALAPLSRLHFFWSFLLAGFSMVLLFGFYQHFIGLEETRKYFFAYELPHYPNGVPPELLKKLSSTRIYSTLFYPNTLAAVILLFSPLLIERLSSVNATRPARIALMLLGSIGGAFCLIWSGSKAGWLIACILLGAAFLRTKLDTRRKLAILVAVVILGAGGFVLRNTAYLKRGATSASARVDYWKAALQGFSERPLTGHGPGTFVLTYRRLKPPEAEMTRLAHNDYLQQASDSGLLGFSTFTLFIGASLYLLYRKRLTQPLHFAIWLGLLGVSLHELVDFYLYVPATAWSQFLLFGWLWGQPEPQTPSTRRTNTP